jgi:hypothetical protein
MRCCQWVRQRLHVYPGQTACPFWQNREQVDRLKIPVPEVCMPGGLRGRRCFVDLMLVSTGNMGYSKCGFREMLFLNGLKIGVVNKSPKEKIRVTSTNNKFVICRRDP